MTGFVYYYAGEKFLLVCDDNKELVGKFNLSKIGLEHIDSYEEFEKLYPAPSYKYD